MGDRKTALHQFAVILDPLSEHAQRWVSLFEVSGTCDILIERLD